MSPKPKVAFCIMESLLRTFMWRPVEFDDEFGFYANEIGHIGTNGNLPPELPSEATVA